MATDDTGLTAASATAGGGGADTEAVASLTVAAEQVHAWELDEDDTAAVADRQRRPWGDAWRHAAALALGGVLVATFALAVFVIDRHQRSDNRPKGFPPIVTSAPTAPVPPAAAAAPPPLIVTPPAPAPAPPPQPLPTRTRSADDAFFLSHMHADGIPYGNGGDDDAIVTAHITCNALADGTYLSLGEQADKTHAVMGWTRQQALDFVTDAVTAYCPQYAR